jgi:hypothetical protein
LQWHLGCETLLQSLDERDRKKDKRNQIFSTKLIPSEWCNAQGNFVRTCS